MQLLFQSLLNKMKPMKINGTKKLKNMYHLTRCDAGLNGLYIVMIRSMHRQRLRSNENDWKKRKNSEFDQQSLFRSSYSWSKLALKWPVVQAKIWLRPP